MQRREFLLMLAAATASATGACSLTDDAAPSSASSPSAPAAPSEPTRH